jgi:hypothetical protein
MKVELLLPLLELVLPQVTVAHLLVVVVLLLLHHLLLELVLPQVTVAHLLVEAVVVVDVVLVIATLETQDAVVVERI